MNSKSAPSEAPGLGTNEYLTFWLDKQQYAIDILRVQEIRGWEAVTRVPRTAGYVRGVLNLRGDIVPVFDLRLRFQRQSVAYSPSTVVVVVKVMNNGDEQRRGMVVDSVSDVINIPRDNFRTPPDSGRSADAIVGLTQYQDQLVMLIDLDRLLAGDEGQEMAHRVQEVMHEHNETAAGPMA